MINTTPPSKIGNEEINRIMQKLLRNTIDLPIQQQQQTIVPIIQKSPELTATALRQIKTRSIPISAFDSELSGLEAICWFLKKEKRFTTNKIAKILNRSKHTINATLQNAKRKIKEKPDLNSDIKIPINEFCDRRYSILESLVAYLIKTYDMKPSQIAKLTGKKITTIKTVWYRYQKKILK